MNTSTPINELQTAIKKHLEEPRKLEELYRKNKTAFQQAFTSVYPDIQHQPAAQIWNERLNFQQEELHFGQKNELIFVLFAAFIAGLIAQIPQLFGINENFFFPRNIGFIVFPMLTAYFAWKQGLSLPKIIVPASAILLSVGYINCLPNYPLSDSILLACIHLPIFLWTLVGYTFAGGDLKTSQKKIDFLRYNGDFVVMTAIMLLSAGLFTAITIGLFGLIGLNIEEFYAKHIIVWGAPAIPLFATYLVQNNPQLVNKISPLIARIFTPIVLVTLFVFLCALIYTGKNLYTDRNFLAVFNALLIGVMALILFSVSEATKGTIRKINLLVLVVLSVLTIILNGLALSAIAFRLFEFGMTPNRLAVVGANVLIFMNLVLVAYKLLLVLKGRTELQNVEQVIAFFVPIYSLWAAIVTFILPIVFQFK